MSDCYKTTATKLADTFANFCYHCLGLLSEVHVITCNNRVISAAHQQNPGTGVDAAAVPHCQVQFCHHELA